MKWSWISGNCLPVSDVYSSLPWRGAEELVLIPHGYGSERSGANLPCKAPGRAPAGASQKGSVLWRLLGEMPPGLEALGYCSGYGQVPELRYEPVRGVERCNGDTRGGGFLFFLPAGNGSGGTHRTTLAESFECLTAL
jgi:hypothetical protein